MGVVKKMCGTTSPESSLTQQRPGCGMHRCSVARKKAVTLETFCSSQSQNGHKCRTLAI